MCIFTGYLIGNTKQSIQNKIELQKFRDTKTAECKFKQKKEELIVN